MKKIIAIVFSTLFSIINLCAQQKQVYANDIQTIKSYDQMYQYPADPILFVGSSSIRKWNDLQLAFGNYNVLNRGIGGAVINDITYYVNELVFTYKPRQIVLYVGENDLPNAAETPDTILNRTIVLYNAIRAKLPIVPIVYISIKPSPSRAQYLDKCIAANTLIKNYLANKSNTTFLDVFSQMLTNGKPRPELFGKDMLHMNRQGYLIWEKAVKPLLVLTE